jgi:hypothetical protein
VRRLLVSVAAAALLLTGCAEGTHPGAAAVVGSTEIPVERVDQVSRAVTSALGQPFDVSVALNELIRSELVGQVTAQRSVTLTEAETAKAMEALLNNPEALQRFEADPVALGFLRDAARSALGTVKLGGGRSLTDQSTQQAFQAGSQIVLDESRRIGVTVSPRFGQWSGDQIANVSGSLSVESDQTKQQREQRQQQQQPQG